MTDLSSVREGLLPDRSGGSNRIVPDLLSFLPDLASVLEGLLADHPSGSDCIVTDLLSLLPDLASLREGLLPDRSSGNDRIVPDLAGLNDARVKRLLCIGSGGSEHLSSLGSRFGYGGHGKHDLLG